MTAESHLHRLNELLAEEVEASVRYLHLAMTIKGIDRLLVRKILLDNMNETLEHAQMVSEKILQLGGIPKLDVKLSLPPQKMSASEALRTAVEFERAALDAYRDLLEEVRGDTVLEEFATAQVALESEHVAELELLLEE